MYRFLRWVVWIAGVFFVFIILAIIAVQIFLSSDEIIRIAEREGQKILGRTISIERLNLGLYKIEASGVVIRGEKEKGGVKSKPFARFNDVELFLNPSALIYKHISILQLTIKGVSAHAHRDANGRFNFQDIVDNLNRWTKKTASAGAKNTRMLFPFIRAAEAAESSKQSVESGFNLTIHELDLHNVKTELRFDASDTTPAFESLCSFAHIEVDEIKSDEPLDVFLDGKCQNSGGQQLIQLMGDAHINTKGRNYRASFAIPLFDSSVLATVAPIVGGYRLRKGIFAGKLGFSYVAGKPVTWDLDLNGRTIHADFQMNRKAVWQRLILPGLKLKTKGQFDLLESSARIETFFVETPFLNAKLTKPIFWNASAKDEVHVEANIRDMGEMGSWVSRITDIPLPELKEGATAQILVSAKRIRKIQDDFVHVEIKSRFDPVDLARFSAFIPPVDNLSKIKGNVSGKARVVFISGDRVEWDVALEAQDFGASVRMEQKKRWEVLELGRAILHSRGNFDMKNESARINALKIKLPFATAKLERPAKWNVNGNDEAAFSLDVNDFSSATDLLERLGFVSHGDVSMNAKILFNATVSRNRKTSPAFRIDTKAHFDSLPIAPIVDLLPLPGYVQTVTGRVSGKLQVSSAPNGVVRWNADIAGKKVNLGIKAISNEKWREISLESMGLQSNGFYLASKGSSEIQTLNLRLPFARAYLNRTALWNQIGKDEFSLTLEVMDLSVAEVWLGRLMEHSIKWGPKKKKLKILLSGTRNRRDELGFTYKGSAVFDPVHISPWVKFLNISPAFRNLAGEIAGKIEFLYMPGKKIGWVLNITSEDLGGEFLALMSQKWRPMRTGKFRIETVGSYDLQNQSGRLRSLKLNMAFGHILIPRSVDWNVNGMDSIRFQWTVSSLEDAARLARSILGDPASKFLVAGGADGLVEISRSRKKTHSISTKWSFAANLSALAHVAYPNLNLTGSVLGQGDDDAINIRIPTLKTINFSKPNSEPDVILRDLSASLNRSSILRGEIRSPSVRINKLNVRYVRHEKGKTNFGSLFKAAKAEEKQTWRMRSRDKTAPTDTRTTSRKPRMAGKKDNGHLFPAIKIAKFEVARLGFHFQDFIAANKPPVVLKVPDARLSITNLDTLMAPNLRETRLEFRTLGESPSLLAKANLNPGLAPPDVDGFFNLSRFDLRKISPYVRDIQGESASALLMRGTEIKKGMLDFKSTYSLRKSQLELEGKAKIAGLRLEPDETFPLADLVVKLLRASVFRLFERPDDTISLNLRVSGRLDDPEFHFLDAIVEPMFVGLFEQAQNLGGNLKDIVTGILGTAIEGVQKIVPAPKSSGAPPVEGTRKEPDGKGNQLEQLGKKLEKTLQKGLRGLFGVK